MTKALNMNIDDAQFTLLQVAKATGVNVGTIRTWFARGIFKLGLTDKENEGEGLARYVSGRTAVAIAIAGALTKQKVPAKDAANAAFQFAHVGDLQRLPGHLKSQMTVLAISGGKTRILAVKHGDRFEKHFMSFFDVAHAKTETIMRIDTIVRRTMVRLGLGVKDVIGQSL